MNGLMTLIKSLAAKHKSGSNPLMHARYGTHAHTIRLKGDGLPKRGNPKTWSWLFIFSPVDQEFMTFSLLGYWAWRLHTLFTLTLFFLFAWILYKAKWQKERKLFNLFNSDTGEYFPHTRVVPRDSFLPLLGFVKNVLVKYLATIHPCEDPWRRHSRRLAPFA